MQFKQIVGQRELINKLITVIENGRVSHAQLFCGTEGVGKLAIAIAYSQYLNCNHRQYFPNADFQTELIADSCGTCPSCIKYQKLAHPDLHFVFPNVATDKVKKDSSSQSFIQEWSHFLLQNNAYISFEGWLNELGVDNKQAIINVRDCNNIITTLSYKSYEANYKVFIIWLIEKLDEKTSSKILKILEEPEERTLFILISQNQDKIIKTILSRTQIVKFPRISNQDMLDCLQNKYQFSQVDAKKAIRQADGNFTQTLSLLTQSDQQREFSHLFIEWMRTSFRGDFAQLNAFLPKIAALGRERQKQFLSYVLDEFSRCLRLNYIDKSDLQLFEDSELQFMQKFYLFINKHNIHMLTEAVEQGIYHVERNVNTNLIFMDLSILLNKGFKIGKTA